MNGLASPYTQLSSLWSHEKESGLHRNIKWLIKTASFSSSFPSTDCFSLLKFHHLFQLHSLVIIELKMRCRSAVLFLKWSVWCSFWWQFWVAGISYCSLSLQTMRRQSSGMKISRHFQYCDWFNKTKPVSHRHPAMQWNCPRTVQLF